jgi:hypothetical protein
MSSRYAQVVIPLAVIRHERKAKQYEDCTLYGVLTKGTQYTFMQMNTEGQVRTYSLDGSDPAQLKRAYNNLVWIIDRTIKQALEDADSKPTPNGPQTNIADVHTGTTEAESSSQTMDFDNDNEQSSPVV